MNNRIGLWILLIAFCFAAAGCQESASQSGRRAQLVGNENIQLKKQIQEKDREIERLHNEIKAMEQQAASYAEQQGQTYKKLIEIIADTTQQLEECKAGKAAQP